MPPGKMRALVTEHGRQLIGGECGHGRGCHHDLATATIRDRPRAGVCRRDDSSEMVQFEAQRRMSVTGRPSGMIG
jgi:hypothetical protein